MIFYFYLFFLFASLISSLYFFNKLELFLSFLVAAFSFFGNILLYIFPENKNQFYVDVSSKNKSELQAIAANLNIKFNNGTNKPDLVNRIKECQNKKELRHRKDIGAKRWISVLIIVIAVIIGIMIRPQEVSEEKNENVIAGKAVTLDDTAGRLCSFYSHLKDEITIQCGGVTYGTSKNELEGGYFDLQNAAIVLGCDKYYPLYVRLVQDELVVTTTVRSYSGEIIASIVDNEWRSNPDNYFTLNMDECGLEIIDDYHIPVLSVDYNGVNSIRIGGVFYCGNLFQIRSPISDATRMMSVTDYDNRKFKEFYLRIGQLLPKLFKYTGEEWFGYRYESMSPVRDWRLEFEKEI